MEDLVHNSKCLTVMPTRRSYVLTQFNMLKFHMSLGGCNYKGAEMRIEGVWWEGMRSKKRILMI